MAPELPGASSVLPGCRALHALCCELNCFLSKKFRGPDDDATRLGDLLRNSIASYLRSSAARMMTPRGSATRCPGGLDALTGDSAAPALGCLRRAGAVAAGAFSHCGLSNKDQLRNQKERTYRPIKKQNQVAGREKARHATDVCIESPRASCTGQQSA